MKGTVSVGVDKGCLRLQFPSGVSQQIWGARQKYKTLGLADTPENRAMAQKLAAMVQLDILADTLDISLKKYNPLALEKTLKQVQLKIPGLLELYVDYLDKVIKHRVGERTFRKQYSGIYMNIIKRSADANIVTDSAAIFDTIKCATTPPYARSLLNLISNLLDWCKRRGIVEESAINRYKSYKEDVSGKPRKLKVRHMEAQSLLGDEDHRGYTPEEAEHIINAFSTRGRTPNLYQSLATFLFLTGCRPSEAIGLEWGDIAEDFSTIFFCHSFCQVTKKTNGLKTARHGKERRKFPCGKRLQELLKKMHEKQSSPKQNDKVFLSEKSTPVSWSSFYHCWVGLRDKSYKNKGVIEALAEEGKLNCYLKPYSCRHSWITWQLNNGMSPADVAKLAGNTPEMIYKHYVSASENPIPAYEL